MDKQILDEHNQIFLTDYSQTYQGLFLHPEAGRDSNVNESLNDIKTDLDNLNNILKNTGESVNNLLLNTTLRLNEIKNTILLEKERLQDMQMLCNRYMDFDNVKTIDNISITGDYTFENDTYYGAMKKTQEKNVKVLDIYGNGYEGNQFVYNDYKYQIDTYDTSVRDHINDGKISTYYEYSRITVQDNSEVTNTYFNKDSEFAKCTISFEAEDLVNFVNISTDDLGVSITAIQTSMDGIKYVPVPMNTNIVINNKLESYNEFGYVYGSGLLEIPMCKYFKLTFETNRNKEDVIATKDTDFNKTATGTIDFESATDPDSWDKTATRTSSNFILQQDKIVPSARRSAIKINDVRVYKKIYKGRSVIRSGELLTGEVYSIALFCNVYVPESLNSDSVEFYLTLNGVDYQVVPINSHYNGTKVLRFSGGKSSTLYTQLLSEKITSACLSIVLNSSSDASPMVNNIKVLIGGEI